MSNDIIWDGALWDFHECNTVLPDDDMLKAVNVFHHDIMSKKDFSAWLHEHPHALIFGQEERDSHVFVLSIYKDAYCVWITGDMNAAIQKHMESLFITDSLDKNVAHLIDIVHRLTDVQYDYCFSHEEEYLNIGLKDKNPFEVDVVVCPIPCMQHMTYRDFYGCERVLTTSNPKKEIAHVVLTINNQRSFCVPFMIYDFDGRWYRDNKSIETYQTRYQNSRICWYKAFDYRRDNPQICDQDKERSLLMKKNTLMKRLFSFLCCE